jgi:hypothetical protein
MQVAERRRNRAAVLASIFRIGSRDIARVLRKG